MLITDHKEGLGLATAARYLIRLAILLPEAIDLPQASKDVECLADQLARCKHEKDRCALLHLTVSAVPDFHFSQFLRHVVQKARKQQQKPATLDMTIPAAVSTAISAGQTDALVSDGLDFSLAEDVFASTDWMNEFNLTSSDQPSNAFPLLSE